jgi:hypothetical protein
MGRSTPAEDSRGGDVPGNSVGVVAGAVVPVTIRDCRSPFAVKTTAVLVATVLVGVKRTVTVAVAPVPPRVKGLPDSMLKGPGQKPCP